MNPDSKKIEVTPGGIMYTEEGNEIKMFNLRMEAMKSAGDIPGSSAVFPDLDSISLVEYYDDGMNSAFCAENKDPEADEPLFRRPEGDGNTIYIGTRFVVIDTDTQENATDIVYRTTVGDLMEIIYIVAHIGEDFRDKRGHKYRLGTVFGVNDVFTRYMELMDTNENLEGLRRAMYYAAGVIKGMCRIKAHNATMVLAIIEAVTSEFTSKKHDFPDRGNDNEDDDEEE